MTTRFYQLLNDALDAIMESKEAKHDACYHKAKATYRVFPSAYASGFIVQCRKKKGKKKKKKGV
jgi:hypothetical protein